MATLKTFLRNVLHLSQLHCDWLASLWDHRTRHSVRSLCHVTESLVTVLGPTASGQASKIIWDWSLVTCLSLCVLTLMFIGHHELEFWPEKSYKVFRTIERLRSLQRRWRTWQKLFKVHQSDDDDQEYFTLPPVLESLKVQFSNQIWTTPNPCFDEKAHIALLSRRCLKKKTAEVINSALRSLMLHHMVTWQ